MKSCKECEKRGTCTELCDEVEAYVNSERKSQRETTYSPIPESNNLDPPLEYLFDKISLWDWPFMVRKHDQIKPVWNSKISGYLTRAGLTPEEKICLRLYYVKNHSQKIIAKKINKSERWVRQLLRSAETKTTSAFANSRGEANPKGEKDA